MKPTVTLRWRTLGFSVAVVLGLLLAITPDNLARSDGVRGLPDDMPADGFAIEPGVLARWLGEGAELSLIDVRQRWEYDEFHIDGATSLPVAELVAADTREMLGSDPIVVIAHSDILAGHVVATLRLAGLEAWALRGGLVGWWDEVLRPASLDKSVPQELLADEVARRSAWRQQFLGGAAGGIVPTVVPPPAPPGVPVPAGHAGGSKSKRGKGC